jgi:hypothetical protein
MKDRTREWHVQRAREKLEVAGVRVVGAVLCGIPASSYYYGSGDAAYYYRVDGALKAKA